MNPDSIKSTVRDKFGDVRFSGSRQVDGVLRLVVETGEDVVESVPEADFRQEYFETDDRFVVLVDPETEEILGTDDVQ